MLPETTANRPEPWNAGQVVAGTYEILEHVGTGGMGVVYRVKDLSNGRVRALKTIRQDLNGETKRLVCKLLESEASALKRLESDFVVRIFDASLEGEFPFVVMEFLPGQDLQHLLDAQGALPAATTVGLLWQAACALKAIHEQGIVHRDLKPANLYLKTRDDGSLELKVLDFSISRLLDRAGERKTTIVVGTRGFMAPEQAAGYDVDHRADIFSLGQVASALLRGPVKHDEPAPEDPLARFKGFRAWHARATAYDREQRFASAIQAVEALADVLGVPLPKRESIKTDAAESMTAAATILGASTRPPLLRTWALAGVAGIGTVLGLLLLNRAEPARELPQSGSSQAPPVSVTGPGIQASAAASTPVTASTAPTPLADTSAQPPALASSEPHKPSSAGPKRSAPSRAPARQRPSDTF